MSFYDDIMQLLGLKSLLIVVLIIFQYKNKTKIVVLAEYPNSLMLSTNHESFQI
jgi:hypothetical protein